MDLTFYIMIAGWVFVAVWIPFIIYVNRKTHPKALFILFFAEMWERFSYYGMRALLVLYMVEALFSEMGRAAADKTALGIYGSYTAMVYLFPVIGGMAADRIYGFRRAILFGGILMMLGHFSLSLEGMFFEGNLTLFYMSLALIIIGNGLFKPNISGLLGKFYSTDDPRKDGGFTIFYMGVNIGALLSILTCGYVGQTIDWHYGFGLAGIGMFFGLLVFVIFGPSAFGVKGLLPEKYAAEDEDDMEGDLSADRVEILDSGIGSDRTEGGDTPELPRDLVKKQVLAGIGILTLVPLTSLMMDMSEVMTWVLLVLSLGILLVLTVESFAQKTAAAGRRLLVVVVLFVFHAVFWALFEQAGGSITLFTDRNVDRVVMGEEIPASIFQFFNSLFIILLAPLFSVMWKRLRDWGKEPGTPVKFVLGLAQLALGFGVVVLGSKFFSTDGMMPVIFIVIMYLFHTMGELSLSPVGLSMITKLSPKRMVGFVMGAWFLSMALANKMAGLIGELTASGEEDKVLPPAESMAVYTETYLIWGVLVVLGAAAVLYLLTPLLKKWMHGIH